LSDIPYISEPFDDETAECLERDANRTSDARRSIRRGWPFSSTRATRPYSGSKPSTRSMLGPPGAVQTTESSRG